MLEPAYYAQESVGGMYTQNNKGICESGSVMNGLL